MNYPLLKKLLSFQIRPANDLPDFRVGDEIKVYWLNKEGKKVRTDFFEGLVIARKGTLNSESFVMRKIIGGVGVEKRFLLHSPLLKNIEIIKKGKVRRAKLYYIRNLRGRLARIKSQPSTKTK